MSPSATSRPFPTTFWVAVVLVVAGWVFLWAGAVITGAESSCVNTLQSVLMALVAPVLQLGVVGASIANRTKGWSILWWGSIACVSLYALTYATTANGIGCDGL